MITASEGLQLVLRGGSYRLHARAFVTRAGELLADNLPIIAGVEEYDESLNVPERVTISVPRIVDGVNYEPAGKLSPLAAYGQRLHVQLGVDVGAAGVEWFDRGEFLITKSTANGDQVDVEAAGLLALIDEARFVTPYSPVSTILGVVRNLVEPAIPLLVSSDLTSRATPGASAGINYDEDRLAALWEVLDAWPAIATMTPAGYLYVYPDTDPDPAGAWRLLRYNRAELPDDVATVIRTQRSSSRDGVYNVVVARGQLADGGQVYAAAYDTSGSASAYGGPFNPFPVPFFYQSPFLTDRPACLAAATSILRRRQRTTFPRYDVTCVPNPLLTGRDGVIITDDSIEPGAASTTTIVETLRLPYTAGAGEMRMTLRATRPDLA